MVNNDMIDRDRISTDLYEAVNADFLKELKIPADRSSIGAFAMIDVEIEKLLLNSASVGQNCY